MTVAASARSAGKTYEEAVGDRWEMTSPMPEAVKKLVVMNVAEVRRRWLPPWTSCSAPWISTEEGRDPGHRGGICQNGNSRGLQQQRPPLDAGCAHGDPGDQPGAFCSDPLPEKTPGNDPGLCGCEAQLLHPELYPGPDCLGRNLSPMR